MREGPAAEAMARAGSAAYQVFLDAVTAAVEEGSVQGSTEDVAVAALSIVHGLSTLLVDGPVDESIFSSLKGVSLSKPDAFAPFQSRDAVYHDDWQDYATNEPTMDGTASAILLMALQRGGG